MLREYSETGEGRIIERGDILQDKDGDYVEVFKVRKDNKIITSGFEKTIKEARKTLAVDYFDKNGIDRNKLRIVQRRFLGKDSKGQDVYRYDPMLWGDSERIALDFIKGYFILNSEANGLIEVHPNNITKVTEPEPVPKKFLQAMKDVEDALSRLKKMVEEVQA